MLKNNFKKILVTILIFTIGITNYPVMISAQDASLSATTNPSVNNIKLNELESVASDPADINPLLIIPTSAMSASIKSPAVVHKLEKRDFKGDENISVIVDNEKASDLKTVLIDPNGKEITANVEITNTDSPAVFKLLPAATYRPGKYFLKIIDQNGATISEQEFTWGVLAINPNKSIYLPGEQADIALAVLDEKGLMVCDGKINLKITDPQNQTTTFTTENGGIIVNKECYLKEFVMKPDYQTNYQTGSVGKYNINLSAVTRNGQFTINDAFEVRSSVPFDVERISATRIYPPVKYPVKLNITAEQDFNGTVEERVPNDFVVSQIGESVQPYDSVRVVSAIPYLNQNSQTSLITLGMPFAGQYIETQGFSDTVTDPLLAKKYKQYGLRGHDGIDFAMPDGTEILAVDDGEVALAGDGDYGQTIVIQHSWGRSYYGHLSEINVKLAEKISKGEVIGKSGHTGLSTAPHLHFGMKLNQNNINNGFYGKIDPAPYLGASNINSNSIVKLISWKISVKKGDRLTLGYNFKAPSFSPQIYLLGPLVFRDSSEVFSEIRQWQIAADVTNYILSGATWQVPSDWSNTNTLEVIGGGGSGDPGQNGSTKGGGGGGGGGGGAYAQVSNTTLLSAGVTVKINVGTAGLATSGGDTWICSDNSSCTVITDAAVIVGAKGGTRGVNLVSGTGGFDTGSKGTLKFSGGNGGNGGAASTTTIGSGGGGGGGAAGSSAAGNAANPGVQAGAGGNGGQGDGTLGGAGGTGCTVTPCASSGNGGNGTEWDSSHGSGGGGGGGDGGSGNGVVGGQGGTSGSYGAGGAGGGGGGKSAAGGGGRSGAQGIIAYTYTPQSGPTLDQLMRHGKWFNTSGVEQPFTF